MRRYDRVTIVCDFCFFFSSRRRHTRFDCDWSSDVCSSDLSMDLYSRFLLQFLYALQNVFGRVETFTFATRLTRVTEHLRGRPYRQVLRRLTDEIGRAAGRGRGEISVGGGSFKKKKSARGCA